MWKLPVAWTLRSGRNGPGGPSIGQSSQAARCGTKLHVLCDASGCLLTLEIPLTRITGHIPHHVQTIAETRAALG